MNYNQYFKYIFLLVAVLFLLFWSIDLEAQCPMCRMTAEGNLKDGGSAGKGLNQGILYMLAMPYLMVSVIGYIWWKNNRDPKQENPA